MSSKLLECDLTKNITITINDEVVGGCIELDVNSSTETKGIGEYLAPEPYAVISTKREYLITLTLTGNYIDYNSPLFDLRLICGDRVITYQRCNIISDYERSKSGVLYRIIKIGSSERSVQND